MSVKNIAIISSIGGFIFGCILTIFGILPNIHVFSYTEKIFLTITLGVGFALPITFVSLIIYHPDKKDLTK